VWERRVNPAVYRGDYARVVFIFHARLRVRLAPGVPHALISRRVVLQKLGRIARRECEIVAATEWLFETLISEKPGSVATTTTVIIREGG
jgi:hypothetical protein